MIFFEITLEPFNFPLLFFIGTDNQSVIDTIEHEMSSYMHKETKDFIHLGRSLTLNFEGWQVIRLLSWNGSIDDYGTLAHELQHCMNYVLKTARQERKDSEWEAYFIGSSTRKILSKIQLCSKQ